MGVAGLLEGINRRGGGVGKSMHGFYFRLDAKIRYFFVLYRRKDSEGGERVMGVVGVGVSKAVSVAFSPFWIASWAL